MTSCANFCVKLRRVAGLMVRPLIRGGRENWRKHVPARRTLLEILVGGFLASFAVATYSMKRHAPVSAPAATLATSVVPADEDLHNNPSSRAVEAKASHAPTEVPVPAETIVSAPAIAATVKGHAVRAAAKPTNHTRAGDAVDVEPVQGRIKLVVDMWALSQPSAASPRVERVHQGNYVVVTGLCRRYVRVHLVRLNRTAYVPNEAVELVKPIDSVFTLTSNSPLLDEPNRWGSKVSEVHKGRAIHVIGIAPGYLKVQMAGGVEGFVPVNAVE